MDFRILCFLYFLVQSNVIAQLEGKTATSDSIAVPFVNIVSSDLEYGTISDVDGFFVLDTAFVKSGDTVSFSHLSFKPKQLVVTRDMTVTFEPKSIDLREVFVIPRNRKPVLKRVGKLTQMAQVSNMFSGGLGHEIGRLVEVPKNKVWHLQNLKLKFTEVKVGSDPLFFRINFYELVDPSEKDVYREFKRRETKKINVRKMLKEGGEAPDISDFNPGTTNMKMKYGIIKVVATRDNRINLTPMNSEDLLFQLENSDAIEIDLRDKSLSFDHDFLVALQLLNPENDSDYVVNMTMFGPKLYYRKNKKRDWVALKLPLGIALSMELEAHQYSQSR